MKTPHLWNPEGDRPSGETGWIQGVNDRNMTSVQHFAPSHDAFCTFRSKFRVSRLLMEVWLRGRRERKGAGQEDSL